MIETLFKAYEENDHLRNVILPLTLGVKRIVFFSRKPYEEKSYAPAKALYDRYLHTEIRFVVLDDKNERQQVCEIFKEYPDAAVDMSGSRYILLLLFAEAVHHQLPVFYFDAEENIVKEYHRQDYSPLKPFQLLTLYLRKIRPLIYLMTYFEKSIFNYSLYLNLKFKQIS